MLMNNNFRPLRARTKLFGFQDIVLYGLMTKWNGPRLLKHQDKMAAGVPDTIAWGLG
jgi:hypothetical protein